MGRALALAILLLGCGDVGSGPATATAAEEAGALAATGATNQEASQAILFVGTSLTAGYGLPASQSYPARIQERLAEQGLAERFRVVNAGVSGDTSAGARRRIGWLLQQPVAAVVLELGANDMLRGQDPAALRANLQAIIDQIREPFPQVPILIAGMQAAPNLGSEYARAFEQVYGQLARSNSVALLPFILEGVAGDPELNQADGIHPTAEGQRVVSASVWAALQPLLGAPER